MKKLTLKSTSPFAEVISGLLLLAAGAIALYVAGMIVMGVMYLHTPSVHGFDVLTCHVRIQPDEAGMTWLDGGSMSHRFMTGDLVIPVQKGSSRFMLNRFTGTIIELGLLFWIVLLARKVVGTLIHAGPFSEKNPTRFRIIGLFLIVIDVIASAVNLLDTHWLANHPVLKGVRADYDLSFSWTLFFAGLILILMAEVFRRGLALQREQELTI